MDDGGCSSECRVINLYLSDVNPWLFVTAQWPWHDAVYATYRIVVAIYFLLWLVVSGLYNEEGGVKYLIYLTTWGFVLQTATLVLQAITATIAMTSHRKIDPADDHVPWYLQLQWLLYNVSTVAAFVITTVYWGIIYNPSTVPVTASMIHRQGINSVYSLIDLFITATPIRVLHVYHAVVFIGAYVVFSAVYPAVGGTDPAGHTYIYTHLDFIAHPGMSVVWATVLVLLLTPTLWCIVFGLYKLRITVYEMVYGLREVRFNNMEVYMQTPPAPTVVYYTYVTASRPAHAQFRSPFVSDHLRSHPMFNYRY